MTEYVEVNGLTTENAILLLEAAEKLGLDPGVVQTQSDGRFRVPPEVADKAGFDENGVPKSRAAKKAQEEAEDREMEEFKNTSNPTQEDEAERAEAAEKRNTSAAKKAAKKTAAPSKPAGTSSESSSGTQSPKSGD